MIKFKGLSPNVNIYDFLIGALIIYISFTKAWAATIVSIVVYGMVKYYTILSEKRKVNLSIKQIESEAAWLDDAVKHSLNNLQIPVCLSNDKGEIQWCNNKFTSVFNMNNASIKNINSIIEKFDVNSLKKNGILSYKYYNILDEYYDVDSCVVDISIEKERRSIIATYFYDVSSVSNDSQYRESIMLIEVDNLDDVIKSIDQDKRPILSGEVEKCITTYALDLSAMIKKYALNKYILTVKDSIIKEEMNRKFNILDKIKDINIGNSMDVTLSIGVGRLGENPMINNNYANYAKDLALGRGGDQVVVKSGEKLDFFGGTAKEVEKRTKVRARIISHALRHLIEEKSAVYIMGHKNADMDSFGSALGLASITKSLGKKCRIVLEDNNNVGIEIILSNMKKDEKYNDLIISSEECLKEMNDDSLLILVDVHSRGYVQSEAVVDKAKSVVIIDHHRRTVDFITGAILTYIEIYASSTSELVTEMIQYMVEKPNINSLEAESLLAGIYIDTKNFFLKTGVRTFEAASFLRKLGADTVDVKKMFGHDLESYIKKSDIIRNTVIKNGIAIAASKSLIDKRIIVSQAADELLNITGVEASFVLAQIKDGICISGRSLGDINVQLILESLGGGGHLTMAGAMLYDVTIDDAVNKLKEALNKYLREGE